MSLRSKALPVTPDSAGESAHGGVYALTVDGPDESYPLAAPAVPQLGHFVLMRQLGVGSMGTVFAAYDDRLDRRVAIKLLHRSAANQMQWQSTLREAKALARVSHPNVVAVYEVGEASGQPYLAMEFVDGVTLKTWQTQVGRTWQDLLSIYLQAGQGLLAAHQAKIIHRDFKPAKVPPSGELLVNRSAAEPRAGQRWTSPRIGRAADRPMSAR